MTLNSFGLKYMCVFIQITLLIWNSPYYYGDIVKKMITVIFKCQIDT